MVRLLSPAELRAGARVPPYHPQRRPLAERIWASASLLDADPATAAFLAGELTGLRASPLGQWLRPVDGLSAPAGRGADQPGRRGPGTRGGASFPLDDAQYGRPAQMIANLVALDTTAVFARAVRLGLSGDGLAWFGPGELVAGPVLRDMISTGRQAGLASVLSTWSTSAAAADELAGLADVLVLAGPQGSGPGRRVAARPGAAIRRARP